MGKKKNAEKTLKNGDAIAEEELAGRLAQEAEPLPDIEVVADEPAPVAEAQEEEEGLRDQFVRLQADFANFRNRTQRQPFDPHRHEALTHLPSDQYPAESCSEQVRRGYLFGEKLLRAAQVVVSSGPAAPAADGRAESQETGK